MDEPKKPEEKAIAKRDETPLGRLMEQVTYKRVQIERVLPKWMTVDRFITQVRFALERSRSAAKLQQCDPKSVVDAVLQAADLGLDPSGRLGSAYLVPYKSECQLIPGYRGLIDLAVRSGFVRSVNAWVIHEADTWMPQNGKIPKHVPYWPNPGQDPNPGEVTGAWCKYTLRNAGSEAVVMTRLELDRIKARSAAVRANKTDSPWFTDEEEQQKKTVVRRAAKMMPLNPTGALNTELERFAKAVELDDEVESGPEDAQLVDTAAPGESKSDRLKKDL